MSYILAKEDYLLQNLTCKITNKKMVQAYIQTAIAIHLISLIPVWD